MLEHGRPWRLPWRLDLVQELLRLREDFEVFDVCVARMIDRGCEHFGRARFDGRTTGGAGGVVVWAARSARSISVRSAAVRSSTSLSATLAAETSL